MRECEQYRTSGFEISQNDVETILKKTIPFWARVLSTLMNKRFKEIVGCDDITSPPSQRKITQSIVVPVGSVARPSSYRAGGYRLKPAGRIFLMKGQEISF